MPQAKPLPAATTKRRARTNAIVSRFDFLVTTTFSFFSLRGDVFGISCSTISGEGLIEHGKHIRPPRAIRTRRSEEPVSAARLQEGLKLICVFMRICECCGFPTHGSAATPWPTFPCVRNSRSGSTLPYVYPIKARRIPHGAWQVARLRVSLSVYT